MCVAGEADTCTECAGTDPNAFFLPECTTP